MKKILINIVLLFFITSNVNAHISHYKNFKKIEMEIFLNNKLIGYNYYFFKIDKDITLITNQIKFTVKVLGATIFEVEGYGEEKYNKDKLTEAMKNTNFANLKKYEEEYGFNMGQKGKFFYLGKENNWKKLLDPAIDDKITELFKSEMSELGYI